MLFKKVQKYIINPKRHMIPKIYNILTLGDVSDNENPAILGSVSKGSRL